MKYSLTACEVRSYDNGPAKLAQRIFGMALGYKDLSDQKILRENPLLQIISDRFIKDALPLTPSQRPHADYRGIRPVK